MSNKQDSPEWRTAITHHSGSDILIRGYPVNELIEQVDFVAGIYLVLTGELPTENQRRMLSALLVSVIDHGIAPSSIVTRSVASCGVPVQASVAAGLLTFGDIHGGAGEECARFLVEALAEGEADGLAIPAIARRIVDRSRAAKRRLPGYGHPLHPEGDPRSPVLVGMAEKLAVKGKYVELALAIEGAITASTGRRIPLNIDGATASIMLDLGIDRRFARPLVLISRISGLAAHAVEEMTREKGWRTTSGDRIEYDGPARRSVDGRVEA